MDFGCQNVAKLAPKWDQTSISTLKAESQLNASRLAFSWLFVFKVDIDFCSLFGVNLPPKNFPKSLKINQKSSTNRVLGASGSVLGVFWGVLGASWSVLGSSWSVLEATRSVLGASEHVWKGIMLSAHPWPGGLAAGKKSFFRKTTYRKTTDRETKDLCRE